LIYQLSTKNSLGTGTKPLWYNQLRSFKLYPCAEKDCTRKTS
jgi:hypothetical protein